MLKPQLSPLDHLITNFDQGLRTLIGKPTGTERKNPAANIDENELSAREKRLAASLMRVNHAGEVSAQALYQGQALTAKNADIKQQMERSAQEENDHLEWCEQRLQELNSHKSLLNPVWYTGSLVIGALAGIAGDKWSLGFVVETEKQVEQHLNEHLEKLPEQDAKSRTIVEKMRDDEIQHATTALEAGAASLPLPIKHAMKITAKIMTLTAQRF